LNLKRIFTLIAIVLAAAPAAKASAAVAHWESLGPEGGAVGSLMFSPDYAKDKTLFTKNEGDFFRSSNAATSWTKGSIGQDRDRLRSIALSPNFAADGTIFALRARGAYRSADGGNSWEKIRVFGSDGSILAVSPNYAKDRAVFIGSFEPSGRYAMFRSNDGGQTWVGKQVSRVGMNMTSLIFSPNYPKDGTMLAAIEEDGVYRSTDRGKSWAKVRYNGMVAEVGLISFSPNYAKDKTAFFAPLGGGSLDGLATSTDGGRTWAKRLDGITQTLAFSPAYNQDKTLFAATHKGLYKSTNSGRAWRLLRALPQWTNYISLTVSPDYKRDKTLYLIAKYRLRQQILIKSINAGKTWQTMRGLLRDAGATAIVPSPAYLSDRTLFAQSAGGIYKSSDSGNSWIEKNSGLKAAEIGTVAASPGFSTDKTLFAGGENGIYKSTDGGGHWSRIKRMSGGYGPLPSIAVPPDFSVGQTLFVDELRGLFKSTDGGASWSRLTAGPKRSPLFYNAISPNFGVDHTLLAFSSTPLRLLKSTNGGGTWRKVKIKAQGRPAVPQLIAFSPTFSVDRTIFAADYYHLFRSTDGGSHWRLITSTHTDPDSMTPPDFRHLISAIFVSPAYAADKTLLMTIDDHTLRSRDGGKTWRRFDTMYDIYRFSPNYANDNTIFKTATNRYSYEDIYRSTDDGQNWTAFTTGLSGTEFTTIMPSPDYANDKTIYAGTSGSGVVSYTFAD